MMPECCYEGCDTVAAATVTKVTPHLNGEYDSFGNGARFVCLEHLAKACTENLTTVVRQM